MSGIIVLHTWRNLSSAILILGMIMMSSSLARKAISAEEKSSLPPACAIAHQRFGGVQEDVIERTKIHRLPSWKPAGRRIGSCLIEVSHLFT